MMCYQNIFMGHYGAALYLKFIFFLTVKLTIKALYFTLPVGVKSVMRFSAARFGNLISFLNDLGYILNHLAINNLFLKL